MATYRNNAVYADIASMLANRHPVLFISPQFQRDSSCTFSLLHAAQIIVCYTPPCATTTMQLHAIILQHLDSFISTFFATFTHKIPPAYNNEVQLTFPFSGKSSRNRSWQLSKVITATVKRVTEKWKGWPPNKWQPGSDCHFTLPITLDTLIKL